MKRGFTLLEVLVAGGVLFIVGSAVVGLSNSIVEGTSTNADRTEANRWATEGLDLVSKIRDDSVKSGGTASTNNQKIWFLPAESTDGYGWYRLDSQRSNNVTSWSISKTAAPNRLNLSQTASYAGTELQNQQLTAYRLICIEAYGAVDGSNNSEFANCNTANSAGTGIVNDGDRSTGSTCQGGDTYCQTTQASLNRNRPNNDRLISSGNAVKVRSVIVWQDHQTFKTVDVGTIFTNWKGFEQEF